MNKNIRILIFFSCFFVSIARADGLIAQSTDDARVYFISPQDGEVVNKEFIVKFGLSGMGVAPAGVQKDDTGHHHLLIDTDIDTIDLTKPLPATDSVKHFGGGQTETILKLSPGKHTLQLILGNYAHIPHDNPVVSEKISIIVK